MRFVTLSCDRKMLITLVYTTWSVTNNIVWNPVTIQMYFLVQKFSNLVLFNCRPPEKRRPITNGTQTEIGNSFYKYLNKRSLCFGFARTNIFAIHSLNYLRYYQ